jgi:hypothetical protein
LSMNSTKFLWPPMVGMQNGPHTFGFTISKGFEVRLTLTAMDFC